MPPRHGKSELGSRYFPPWYLGTFPDRWVILASYSAELAEDMSRFARDLLAEHGERLFGVKVRRESSSVGRWQIEGRRGGMIACGVGGSITGRGASIFLIDDPVKDAKEALSETVQSRNWDWYQSVATTRLEPGGSIVLTQTRWHEKDLAGLCIAHGEANGQPWSQIKFPAIAEESDELGRKPGEALWPSRFSLEQLESIRAESSEFWWSALYQQNPVPREGGFFKRAWFGEPIDRAPELRAKVRAWDLAATEGDGDWTVGVKVGKTARNEFVVLDVIRARLSPGARDDLIVQIAERDGKDTEIALEQEPGSGGKAQVDALIKRLAGYRVRATPSSGDKQFRADPVASQAQRGFITVVRAPWNEAYLNELCAFPRASHDDQVDATSSAFERLLKVKSGASIQI